MRRRFLIFCLILIILSQGCGVTPKIQIRTSVSTPSVNAVTTPTISLPTLTFLPTLTPIFPETNTPVMTVTPTQVIHQSCLADLPTLAEDKSYSGKLVLIGDSYANFGWYFLNLATRQTTRMTQETRMYSATVDGMAISPDHSKIVVDSGSDHAIQIYAVNGALLGILERGQRYIIDQWLDNERILFKIVGEGPTNKYPPDEVVVDINTGKKTTINSDYPDIDTTDYMLQWEGVSTTKYDSTMSRVVYPGKIEKDYRGDAGWGYILYDRVNHVKIAQIVTSRFTTPPVWFPDGSKFIVNMIYGDGEFYVITRDGAVSQVSHLNSTKNGQNLTDIKSASRYSWSPDGHYLAFWLEMIKLELNSVTITDIATFAILDILTGETTDYCLSAGYAILGGLDQVVLPLFYKPVWSPDGKSVVTIANRQKNGNFDTVLIDPAGGFAARIADNLVPEGWLDSTGK